MNTLQHIVRKFNLVNPAAGTVIAGSRSQELLDLFRELKFKTGVEIGVDAGIFSEKICKANPILTLSSIDPWVDRDDLYQTTQKYLRPYKCNIIRDYSEKAHVQFADNSLDFVYIDGDHEFFHVTQDLHHWIPKVKTGGIIAGHDFQRNSNRHINDVKDVIPAYTYAYKISPWFVLSDPQEGPSWFWVQK